ncbi:MAG: hypothetical protein J7L86_08620, partial [Candidatus Marinimicrobia bacterium]|nr:hypothetical protein [Candidatus Neomarinimicrobiota bacterium]
CKIRMCAVNSEGLSDRFLDYAASIIIIAKIRDRIICDKSGVLGLCFIKPRWCKLHGYKTVLTVSIITRWIQLLMALKDLRFRH